MEDDPHSVVDQLYVGPVIRSPTLAQDSEAGAHRMRKPKKMQCLIDEVRSKIEP